MHTVIQAFNDKADGAHPYKLNDTYPRKGFTPDSDRIKMLVREKFIRETGYTEPQETYTEPEYDPYSRVESKERKR